MPEFSQDPHRVGPTASMVLPFDPGVALIFASCSLFLYDGALNFQDEIFCIWTRAWRPGKVAYIWAKCVCVVFLAWSINLAICTFCSTCVSPQGVVLVGHQVPFYVLTLLVYVSCQGILGARVYALLGESKILLASLVVLFVFFPVGIAAVEYTLGFILFPSASLLPSICILGLVSDGTLFTLIIMHAVRRRGSRSIFSSLQSGIRTNSSNGDAFSAVPIGRSGSNSSLLSLIVSDSVKYYSFMLAVYVTALVASRFVKNTDPDVSYVQLGLVTAMTALMGVLAPRLLLSIRKEFYAIAEPRIPSAELRNRRIAVSWSTHDSAQQYVLPVCLQYPEIEHGHDPEGWAPQTPIEVELGNLAKGYPQRQISG